MQDVNPLIATHVVPNGVAKLMSINEGTSKTIILLTVNAEVYVIGTTIEEGYPTVVAELKK